MTHPILGRGASDRRSVRGSVPRTTSHRSTGSTKRRGVAIVLSPLVATAGMVGIASTPADAAVTVGAITAFPDRDMVGISGYNIGEVLTVKVLNGTTVLGQVTAAAVASDDGGGGLEINHGVEGATAADGDCWEGATGTPNIAAGHTIEVTSASRAFTDTMTVADVHLGARTRVSGAVRQSIFSSLDPEVRFRYRPTDFRARNIPVEGTRPNLTAVFSSASAQELEFAMDADWRADVIGADAGLTIAESDGVNGPAAGCPTGGQQPPGSQLPGPPTIGTAVAGDARATVNWTPPDNLGTPALVEYDVQVRSGGVALRTVTVPAPANSHVVTGLDNGTAYNFRVRGVQADGQAGTFSAISNTVTPAGGVTPPPPTAKPGAPVIGTAISGVRGAPSTATAVWSPPTTGGAPTGYRVRAFRSGNVVKTSVLLSSDARRFEMRLPAGSGYRFKVLARNAAGTSPLSAFSNAVTAR